jgi:hypothetical protein
VFLVFACIAGALVFAVVIGGDIRRLSLLHVSHVELIIAAFVVKLGVALLGATQSIVALDLVRPLNVIGVLLLLGVAWFNRRIPGARIFGLGLLTNLVVILWFGGRMPVLLPSGFAATPGGSLPLLRAGLDPLHVLLLHPTGPWFLGDIFVVPGIIGRTALFSAGDLMMAAGVAYLIVRASQRPKVLATQIEPSPAK